MPSKDDNPKACQQEVCIPKLEQMSYAVLKVNDKLKQKVLEVEVEHNINTKQRMNLIGEMMQTMHKKTEDANCDHSKSIEVESSSDMCDVMNK